MKFVRILAFLVLVTCCSSLEKQIDNFRPPAVPLITFDPYMNIWSMGDNLYDDWPRLWDGTIKALTGLIRIDNQCYRFMGSPSVSASVIKQQSVKVYPTQTVYEFATSSVKLTVTFTTPSFTDLTDYDLLSVPITYLTFSVVSLDGKTHEVQLYYDNTGEIAVNSVDEQIVWSRIVDASSNMNIMKMGTQAQNIFGLKGDAIGINWGYAYVAANQDSALYESIYGSAAIRSQFILNGTIPSQDDTQMPRAASDNWPVMAVNWNFGLVGSSSVSRYLIFAYDDIYSINYFNISMPPYWRRNGASAISMIRTAQQNYEKWMKQSSDFDEQLINKLNQVGGEYYATIGALAYRQTFAGCKLVWNPKIASPWYFMKEISSDGDLSTVDVIFPASPLIIYENPQLMNLLILPLLSYANNETTIAYNLTWAPHHLGFYPVGDIKPMDQEQMPMEETGNILILLAVIAKQTNKLDSTIYPHYWDLLVSWADYLVATLPDPGDQLCTDDFEGPSPHNVNLAAKGILALDAFSYLCKLVGDNSKAQQYHNHAIKYASYWTQYALDKNHYRLQYNLPNTWSLKYNIMYQKVIGLQTFPESVFKEEVDFYLNSKLFKYGIPLDNRGTFTKLDWESWVAAMSPDHSQFLEIIKRIYDFANETTDRIPLTDWYYTQTPTAKGFRARTVVGGVYAKMLMQ